MNYRFRTTGVLAALLGVSALTAQAQSTSPTPPLQPVLPDGRHDFDSRSAPGRHTSKPWCIG